MTRAEAVIESLRDFQVGDRVLFTAYGYKRHIGTVMDIFGDQLQLRWTDGCAFCGSMFDKEKVWLMPD